jgi:hypothetical protein
MASPGRCVLAGFIAGLAAAGLANLTALVLSQQLSLSFDQLNWYLLTRVTVVLSVLAGFLYFGLLRWTTRPVLWFSVIGLAVAAAHSVVNIIHPPEAGFARIASPIDFVVTLTFLMLIPALVPAIPERNKSEVRGSPTPPPLPKQS